MSDILIKANNICKIYDQDILLKRGANFYALQAVDFVLEEGDFISVMGPSGSGKSTLLNCLSTLDKVSSGTIRIFDKVVGTMSDNELSDYRNQYLGFIFQNHNLVPTLTMFDNIATPLILNGTKPDIILERVNQLAQRLNIVETLYKKPNECSGGERQRVAIARALVTNPKILFCDEPTGNLDSKNSHELLELLKELNKQGTSIIIVTHDNMIASYAKKFMYLRDGQIMNMIERNDASQVDFFNEIVKVTTQDSLLKLFDPDESNKKTKEIVETKSTVNVENRTRKNNFKVRSIVYAIFAGIEYDETLAKKNKVLNFDEDAIRFRSSYGDEIVIGYNQVKVAKISMCSRFVMCSVIQEFRFYVDLDLIIDEQTTYKFEVLNQRNSVSLFDILEKHQVTIDDPYGVISMYRKIPDYWQRHKYFQHNYKAFAREHNLDNPRGEKPFR